MTTRKAKPAAKPKRKAPAAVKTADRAEPGSAGKPIDSRQAELMEAAKATKRYLQILEVA